METSPDGIKEVFDYAYQLHLQIEEDMKNNEYTYAMHKLKAMAHTLIDAIDSKANVFGIKRISILRRFQKLLILHYILPCLKSIFASSKR